MSETESLNNIKKLKTELENELQNIRIYMQDKINGITRDDIENNKIIFQIEDLIKHLIVKGLRVLEKIHKEKTSKPITKERDKPL